MTSQRITAYDSCTIQDFMKQNSDLIAEKKQKAPYVGLVRLIKDGKVVSLEDTPTGWMTNVTVGIGREFVAQRVFNLASGGGNLTVAGTSNVTGFSVSHFGIGHGGSTIVGGTPQLVTPTVADNNLAASLQINNVASTLDYNDGTTNSLNVAKPITSNGGSVVFQTDIASNSHYSSVLSTCVVAAGEPIVNELGATLTTGNAAKIDEAMLFATSGTAVIPFAHISFMPKYIELEASLTIEWYVIF